MVTSRNMPSKPITDHDFTEPEHLYWTGKYGEAWAAHSPTPPVYHPSYNFYNSNVVPDKLYSAFRVYAGGEPHFTTYATNTGTKQGDDTDDNTKADETFIGTVDYVFCNSKVRVIDVSQLPYRDHAVDPLPSEVEPSDHLMLSVTVQVQTSF